MAFDFHAFADSLWTAARALPWHWIAGGAHLALGTLGAAHAMLYKRDPRAALGWVSVCLFFPLAGALLYYMFGINRIQTQARRLSKLPLFRLKVGYEGGAAGIAPGLAAAHRDPRRAVFERVSDRVTSRPLTAGNSVEMLCNGAQAYPLMLDAIHSAGTHVLLVTYLFEADEVGEAFIEALAGAQRRGVKVRVIVDGVGELYSWPRMSRRLRRAGVRVARFLPPRLFPPAIYMNLRNHRKILVVDGETGFTGGMNIGARHLVEAATGGGTADLHFRVRGPVVSQLEAIFADDWRFASGENLMFGRIPRVQAENSYCRCISDGPNDDMDRISLVMMGAISAAQRSITLITPYFLPSRELIASLQSAALRGVDVAVILPLRSNLRFVDWATRKLLWELLQYGVKVVYQPPPFAHTKLFIVDDVYAQVGSANLDPRSLRLNFELNLEVMGQAALARMVDYAGDIRCVSTPVTLQEVEARSLPVRLRDAACWLFMPYL